jgi:hypothetical protein
MIRFVQDFRRDFEQIYLRGEPYAFARFGDGERRLCMGQPITVSDGWNYDGSDTALAVKMREIVSADVPGFYLGISCACCDPEGHDWYMAHIKAPPWRVTFANLFVNANYRRFRKLDLSNTVLVSSTGGDFTVPRNAVNPPFDHRPLVEELCAVDKTILVAAGPVGKAIVYDYWTQAPEKQIILDVGSTLDEKIYGTRTRKYQKRWGKNARKVCRWWGA